MTPFSFSKVDKFRYAHQMSDHDVIDIKFPSEILEDQNSTELLIFIVDDDPVFMQTLNSHFTKLRLTSEKGKLFRFSIRNYATGRSCINDLPLKPDLILLDYFLNEGLPHALSGKNTLEQILELNPTQKVMVMNDLDRDIKELLIQNGIRDIITKDPKALPHLNKTLVEVLNR